MNLRETMAVERNIELGLLVLGIAALGIAWRSLNVAGFNLPPDTETIVTQFIVSAVAAHLAVRLIAPRASAEPLAIGIFLAAIGLAFIIRLAPDSARNQVHWITFGCAVFVVACALGRRYRLLTRYTYSAGAAAIAVLVFTGLFGTTINGARLWFTVGGQSIQTTEVIKLFVLLFLAGYLSQRGAVLAAPGLKFGGRTYSALPSLLPLAGLLLAAIAALALLKDLGSIALLVLLAVVMVYVATGRARYLVGGVTLLAITGALGYFAFTHVQVRVDTWLNPEHDPGGTGYQAMQATYSIQAGGVTGAGLGLGQPDKIPAAPTDYIFSAIAEELGLAGAAGICLAYLAMLFVGLKVSAHALDDYGRFLAAGITLLIAIQAAVIIGGNLRIIPTTGITLPFVSYGGSSIVVNFALIGLLAGISHASQTEN
jgi:peptidoglycan glycosyltransferase